MENPSSPSPEASQGGSLRGRFSEATDEFVQVFTASIDFDRRLYREDIAGGSVGKGLVIRTTISVLQIGSLKNVGSIEKTMICIGKK